MLILYSFFFGIVMAVLYDAVRLLRTFFGCGLHYSEEWDEIKLPIIGDLGTRRSKKRVGKHFSSALLALFDLLYMITASVSVLLFMYAVYDGIVRSFSLISMAAAFILYMKTVGAATKNASGAILYGIRVAVRYILYFILTPTVFILRLIGKGAKRIYDKSIGRIAILLLNKRAEDRSGKYLKLSRDVLLNNISSAIRDAGKNA